MAAEILIAFHRVYHGFQVLDLPMEQCVTSEMLKECMFAHSRYQIYMEEKKESVETERAKKRKALGEELSQAERKKRKLESMLADVEKEADQPAFDVERQNKMGLLVRSNTHGSKAREQTMELETEKQRVQDLQSKLKDS